MYFENAVVTNAGRDLLAQWIEGTGVLNISNASIGTGKVPVAELIEQTDLVESKHSMSIVGKQTVSGGVSVKLRITSIGLSTGFESNQIGIFANIDGGENVLLAIFQDENGVLIPSETDVPQFVFSVDAIIQMDNTGTFVVNIDSQAFVTFEELEEHNRDPFAHPELFNRILPIGMQYLTFDSTFDPSSKWGGSWSVESISIGNGTISGNGLLQMTTEYQSSGRNNCIGGTYGTQNYTGTSLAIPQSYGIFGKDVTNVKPFYVDGSQYSETTFTLYKWTKTA